MTDLFSRGDRVTVSYEGTVTSSDTLGCGLGRGYLIRTDDGFVHTVHVYGSSAAMEVAVPKYWPPEPGDVWTANGIDWFAVENADSDGLMVPSNLKTYVSCSPARLIQSYPKARIRIRGNKVFTA